MISPNDNRARSGRRRIASFFGLWLASTLGFALIVDGTRALLDAAL